MDNDNRVLVHHVRPIRSADTTELLQQEGDFVTHVHSIVRLWKVDRIKLRCTKYFEPEPGEDRLDPFVWFETMYARGAHGLELDQQVSLVSEYNDEPDKRSDWTYYIEVVPGPNFNPDSDTALGDII